MKNSKLLLVNLIVAYIMSLFITMSLVNAGFFGNSLFEEIIRVNLGAKIETLIFFLIVGFICFFGLNLIYLPIYIIKILATTKDNINKKYVDTKQSIYTRDLPEYNSSIAGEILDFKTTFQEEYAAGVIELIAKGYIIDNEDFIQVDKTKSTEGLLKNEKYILETCENINSNLYLINNYSFYKELKEDMYDLGLYKKSIFLDKVKNKILYYTKNNTEKTYIIIHMIFIVFIFFIVGFVENFVKNLVFLALLYVIMLIFIRKNKLTKNGELEKEKMGKLKLFLEKEMNFKDKGEVERKLWGRYSAFAVAFGLNTEMSKALYNKIIKKLKNL